MAGIATATLQDTSNEDEFGDDQGVEAAVERLEADDDDDADTNSTWWYFDTASNSHVTGRRADFVSFTKDTSDMRSFRGLSPDMVSRIAGVGTVGLANKVDGEEVIIYVDDLFYVPDAEYGLFSLGLAHEQGFEYDYGSATRNFIVSREGVRVVTATPQEATWGFQTFHGSAEAPVDRPLLRNYSVAEAS